MGYQPRWRGHGGKIHDADTLEELKRHGQPEESLGQTQTFGEEKYKHYNGGHPYPYGDGLEKSTFLTYDSEREVHGHTKDNKDLICQVYHQLHLILAVTAMLGQKGMYTCFQICEHWFHAANIHILVEDFENFASF